MDKEIATKPFTYVLFGATGNLAQIKIIPALCSLFANSEIPEGSKIVGYGRREWGDVEYREFIRPLLTKFDEQVVSRFLEIVEFSNGVFDEGDSYVKLGEKIKSTNTFFHLAVLPQDYLTIIKNISKAGLKGKLLIEKPFGGSEDSAKNLEDSIEMFFEPKDILRIDHYLSKQGVQNILKEKSKEDFEAKLNNKKVVQIVCRLREVIDIQGRGEFYDRTGALKDVVQNHAMEVVATLMLDIKKDIMSARSEVLESLVYMPRSLIRGQYVGYLDEKGVSKDSVTETYIKISLQSNLEKWEGVEIVIEAGKALESENRKEEVVVRFVDGSEHVFDLDVPKHYNAYEGVIRHALANEMDYFVDIREVYALWRCTDNVIEGLYSVPLIFYKKGEGPNFTNNR